MAFVSELHQCYKELGRQTVVSGPDLAYCGL